MDVRPKTIWKMSKLPGPRGFPVLGLALDLVKLNDTDIIEYWFSLFLKYERLAAVWGVGIPYVIMFDANDIETLLTSPQHIKKGFEYNLLEPWLQEGLLLSSGEKWHQRRKLLTPAFHFKILENNFQTMNKNARYLLRNMLKKNGESFAIEELIIPFSLEVICESAMGYSLNLMEGQKGNKDYLKAVRGTCNLIVERFLKFYYNKNIFYNLTLSGRKYRKNLKYLHEFTKTIIKERKNNFHLSEPDKSLHDENKEDIQYKKRKPFLDLLIELDQKTGNLFTDKDIQEEVDTFMFEGHDTTASAFIHCIYVLGKYQQVQERVYKELYEIFGESDRAATSKDIHEMHYLEMVIKETLRLYPSVPYITRTLTQDLILSDNMVIPEGVNVGISPFIVHRNPKYFPNPEVFEPERFTVENCKSRHPFAYIPFSAGPRNCIGQKFAMMELKIALSTIIRFSKVESVNDVDDTNKLVPAVILRSKTPLEIKVTSRGNVNGNV